MPVRERERETKTEHGTGNGPGKGSGNHSGNGQGRKSVFVETVVFVPYTPDSGLKNLLQKADDELSATLNRPRVRFVERGGTQIARDVGKPNPWASEFYCTRDDCQVCSGRLAVEAEKEEAALAMLDYGDGSGKTTKAPPTLPKQEDQVALPGCTREGVVYLLECRECRDKGIWRHYI